MKCCCQIMEDKNFKLMMMTLYCFENQKLLQNWRIQSDVNGMCSKRNFVILSIVNPNFEKELICVASGKIMTFVLFCSHSITSFDEFVLCILLIIT